MTAVFCKPTFLNTSQLPKACDDTAVDVISSNIDLKISHEFRLCGDVV